MHEDRPEQFWMVWCPQGGAPTVRQLSHHEAIKEAERLATKCPGREFFVLQATDLRIASAMQRIRLTDDVPF